MNDDTGCLIRGIGVPIIFIVVFNLLPSSMDSTGRALLSGISAWIGCGIVCLIFADEGSKGTNAKTSAPLKTSDNRTIPSPNVQTLNKSKLGVSVAISQNVPYQPKGQYEFEIRGIDKCGIMPSFFTSEKTFDLRREYDNLYDKNTIGVFHGASKRIGYVAKEVAARLAPKMDAGWKYEVANIVGAYSSGKWGSCYVRVVHSTEPTVKRIECPNCGNTLANPNAECDHRVKCPTCGVMLGYDQDQIKLLFKCLRCGADILSDKRCDGDVVWCPSCRYVHIYCSDNLPAIEHYPWFERSSDADAIRSFVVQRGISRIVHFTSFPSLVAILKTGQLMSRLEMDRYRMTHPDDVICQNFHSNDEGRWDKRLECINMSIERINTRLLWTMQQRQENVGRDPWCILEVDPTCIEKAGVLFTVANAASRYVRLHGTASGIDGLAAMFADTIVSGKQTETHETETYTVTRSYKSPRNRPTDPQAEVLVPGALSIEMLDGIVFKSVSDRDYAKSKLMKDFPILREIPLKVCASDFDDKPKSRRIGRHYDI
jgi:DNA-directed RNA polymerase subunit RPC12/RpoP